MNRDTKMIFAITGAAILLYLMKNAKSSLSGVEYVNQPSGYPMTGSMISDEQYSSSGAYIYPETNEQVVATHGPQISPSAVITPTQPEFGTLSKHGTDARTFLQMVGTSLHAKHETELYNKGILGRTYRVNQFGIAVPVGNRGAVGHINYPAATLSVTKTKGDYRGGATIKV